VSGTAHAGALAVVGDAYVSGTAHVGVLQITGGADLAETFPVRDDIEPGTVVAIDPDRPGELCIAKGAYNPRVAGVISGQGRFALVRFWGICRAAGKVRRSP